MSSNNEALKFDTTKMRKLSEATESKKDLYAVKFIGNKFALEKLMPISFEAVEIVEKITGIEARKRYTEFLAINPFHVLNTKPVPLFIDEKEYSVTTIALRRWHHAIILKKIKDQKGLDKYLTWLKFNDEQIKNQYPQLLEKELKNLENDN